MEIYKNNELLTKEQLEEINKIQGICESKTVLKLIHQFLEENYTDEFRQKLNQGLVEGVGIEE